VVQNSSSGEIVANFHMTSGEIRHCCFSPDGRLIATATVYTVHVWDTTNSHPHPIKTFVGHTGIITSLAFSSPSSLISSSFDNLVKFWEIGILQADPAVTNPESTSLTPAHIVSITLQAEDGIAISSDLGGVMRIWDISTGLCKAFIHTIGKDYVQSDVRLVDGTLILVWCPFDVTVQIWDIEGEDLLDTVELPSGDAEDVRISGDGSNILCLYPEVIEVWSMETRDIVNELKLDGGHSFLESLAVDGSKAWVCTTQSELLEWDFETPGSPPVQLSNPPARLANNAMLWDIGQSRIEDVVTGRVAFQLLGKFANPVDSQWDGRYLVAGYESGEVLILDFNHVHF